MYLAKDRARTKKLPFSLTAADVFIPKRCPVLGTVLRDSRQYADAPGGRRRHSDNSPSLDRIVPAKGYVPGNVRVISWRANKIRGDATLKEIRRLYLYLTKQGAR